MRQPPLVTQDSVTAYPVTAWLCVLALLATLAWWTNAEVSFLFSDARASHGEPWRLVTACLPHVNVVHLAFNLYWLWVFGTLVEDVFGQGRTGALLLFLAAGSSAVAGAFREDGVGLSGVGYGLFALLWVLGRHDWRFREAVDEQTTALFVGWFFLCIVLTQADVIRVGNIAHAAGAALGALAGLAVAERRHRLLLFALARVGEKDATRRLLRSAAGVLGRGDEVHRCLLAAFTYRVEQALAGRPHAGPLAAEVFAPLAKAGGGAGARILRYKVDRLRERSRVLEPEERVNPFAPWQGKYDGDLKELTALADVKDRAERETRIRRLLTRVDEGKAAAPRLRILAGVLTLSAGAGDALAADLLRRAAALSRELAGSKDPEVLTQQAIVVERALALAVNRGRKEDAKVLAALAGDWLKRAGAEGRLHQSGNLTGAALRALRSLKLRDEARRLLESAGEPLPREKGLGRLRARYADGWPDAVAAVLQQASGWLYLGQADRAAPAIAEAQAILFPAGAPAPERKTQRVAYARLACAYAAAAGHEPPGQALKRLEELFRRLDPVPDTFTTATHYALLELSVIEAAAFALAQVNE